MSQSRQASGHLRPVSDLAARAVAAHAPAPVVANSWLTVDLYEILKNPRPPMEPTIFKRTDGLSLFYPGKLHLLSGEPEAGKSQLATAVGVSEMHRHQGFAYIDFEDTAEAFVERCQSHGANMMQLTTQAYYVRPETPIEEWSRGELIESLRPEPSSTVWDANTEALSLHGLDSNSGTDWAAFVRSGPAPLADATGAAQLLLDHVAKDRDSRGRFAIGTGHKLASVDVAFVLEAVKPFGRGSAGTSRLRLVKDRPGYLRQHTNDSGVIGIVNYTPGEGGALSVTVDPPDAGGTSEFRPTALMERASRHIEGNPGESTRQILEAIGGKREFASKALRCLDDEGFVTVDKTGSARRFTSARPFRENDDRYPTVTQGGDELGF